MLLKITAIFSFAAIALAATSAQLDSSNFHQSISSGTWLIEHYTPTCSHSIAFESTWNQLIAHFEQDVHFGQVDCDSSEDICKEYDVKATPALSFFKDGVLSELHAGSNAYKDLANYIQSHLFSLPSYSESSPPNPYGEVTQLSDSNFQNYVGNEGDGKIVWIKYFAPWCPHCQRLAPVWEELAEKFRGRLNIASVDCEQHHKLCQNEKVSSYPTFTMYSDTNKKVYKGGRNLKKLTEFAEKVVQPGMLEITSEQFETSSVKEEIFYLFLHSPLSSTNYDQVILDKSISGLIGGPRIYRSKDDRLFAKYGFNLNDGSVFLAFKDNDLNTPASKVKLTDFGSLNDEAKDNVTHAGVKELTDWLKFNSFPTVVDASTVFNELLNADTQQYLVILPLEVDSDDFESSKSKLAEIAKAWMRGGRNMMAEHGVLKGGPGSSTIFAWVDAKKYNRWLWNMYGYTHESNSGKEHRQVIIADPNRLEYYNMNFDGQTTTLDGLSIFSALEGVYQGQLQPKSSQNAFEYTIQTLHKRLTSFKQSLVEHPFRTFIIIVLIAVGLGVAIYAMSGDSSTSMDDGLHLFSSGTAGKGKSSARDYYQPTNKDSRRID
ncbi:hypothetical protein E3P94_02465 [Wallemia ichthyophaga]|nr:hypothetical protein E3P95_02348 [Wallemia ichthyophaga]TIA99662.1 hypothetical protein E3P94_02465 [Wallemia ichthyophaga]